MPNCFKLSRKADVEKKPVVFQDIDVELCKALAVPVHPTAWVHDWYNWIGLALACGQTFEQIRGTLDKYPTDPDYPALCEIVRYLDEHYTASAWYESSAGRKG